MKKATMLQQVAVLACAQAFFQTVSVMVMILGGLAGAQLSPYPELATLPIAALFLGTAVMMFPASTLMAKKGRRMGFMLGALLGFIGGIIAATGIGLGSFSLLVLGTFFIGTYQAFAQFYRFAASEVADNAFRPKAISFVLTGGIVAAVLGPALAKWGDHFPGPAYFGAFVLLTGMAILGYGVLMLLKMPASESVVETESPARPWQQIILQPTYLVALFGALTGYGVMILAMTATPLAMMHHHHSFAAATTVIQFHVLAMFLPSFITGSLITRFGALKVMLLGILLLTMHVLSTMTGTGFNAFISALILLGVGWNFLFIGGTTLLTSTYSPAEKSRAQAINDMVIFAVGLVCSFSAGGLLNLFGWQRLNSLLLPWLALAALVIIWRMVTNRMALRQQQTNLPQQ